jgi:trigger factor
MQAGEHAFLPEFGEGVIGATPGEQKTIQVRFPDDFQDAGLRGKRAAYTVDVKQVREKVIPALTEEHLKTIGVSTEDELRERIAADLADHRSRAETQRLRNEIVTELVQRTPLDLPESVVAEETRQTVYTMVRDITRRGAGQDVVEERRDEIFDIASRSAADKVKARYILSRIGAEEGVTVSEDDVSARIQAMAAGYATSPEALRGEIQKRGQLENLERDLLFEKTLDFLLEEAKVEEA